MSQTHEKPGHRLPPSTPRWVKVSVIIVIALFLLFVILHLAGNGLGGHRMHRSALEHGR